ncbi:head-tail connector protein [Pediococcus argentinicus]|uniref:head-tail connector protein n=1 Tax=Pediococcus argentinicus TaxID=480391 RepID=UPI00338EC74A
MSVTVDDIKKSLRIDLTDDDSMIQMYIDTATQYVLDAVDSSTTTAVLSKYEQFDFAVSLLTQFWYSNRNSDMKETPYQVVSMIQQLRGKTLV